MRDKILIIEDESNLLETIALNLEIEGFNVEKVSDGNLALKAFNSCNPSLVLLDVMLPGVNGFDLCRQMKMQNPKTPIIFLTAKSLSSDKITGLKLGADDYITKPFELEELLLRINNVLKRHLKEEQPQLFKFGGHEINFETYVINSAYHGQQNISKREIALLKLLIDHKNKVVSRDEIIEKLWSPEENPSSRTIDNYILNFRKWFEANPKEPIYFHSVRGVGYKFTV